MSGAASTDTPATDERTKAAYKLVGKLHPTTLYNERWIAYIEEMHNRWFETYTGENIRFHITPHSQPYMSNWGCALNLWKCVIPLLTERPTVWEPMCGGGSDSVMILHMLDVMNLYASDKMPVVEHQNTRNNLNNYMQKFPEYKEHIIPMQKFPEYEEHIIPKDSTDEQWNRKVVLFRDYSWVWIAKYAEAMRRRGIFSPKLTVIYVDPSYNERYMSNLNDIEHDAAFNDEVTRRTNGPEIDTTGPDVLDTAEVENTEIPPEILLASLEATIFKHLAKHKIQNEIFILKVRWQLTPQDLEKAMGGSHYLNENYTCRFAIQALPNIKTENREWSEKLQKFVIIDHNGIPLPADKFGKVKGQFHWLVFTRKAYEVKPDDRTWWYEKECLPNDKEREEVYVRRASQVRPYKPSYCDHLPEPDVIAGRNAHDHTGQKIGIDTIPEVQRSLWKRMPPTISKTETMKLDLTTYIKEIQQQTMLIRRARTGQNVGLTRRTIQETEVIIKHVTTFYIDKQEYYRSKKGTTAKQINSLIIALVKTVGDAQWCIKGGAQISDNIQDYVTRLDKLSAKLQVNDYYSIPANGLPNQILTDLKKEVQDLVEECDRTSFSEGRQLQRYIIVVQDYLREQQVKQVLAWSEKIKSYRDMLTADTAWSTYTLNFDSIKKWIAACRKQYTDHDDFKHKNAEITSLEQDLEDFVKALRTEVDLLIVKMEQVQNDMKKDTEPKKKTAKQNTRPAKQPDPKKPRFRSRYDTRSQSEDLEMNMMLSQLLVACKQINEQ